VQEQKNEANRSKHDRNEADQEVVVVLLFISVAINLLV